MIANMQRSLLRRDETVLNLDAPLLIWGSRARIRERCSLSRVDVDSHVYT